MISTENQASQTYVWDVGTLSWIPWDGVINASISGVDGAITDGVSSSIKATVFDYTSSNPLAVRLTDTAGDYIAAGAGTQYTEDAAAAADPVGNMAIARRKDTLSGTEVSADGDNIALNATSKGELYVKQTDTVPVSGPLTDSELRATAVPVSVSGVATAAKQDTGNTSLSSIDGKITAVNTGAVVVSSSALPSGASTAAKQPALGTAGTASADVLTVQGITSMTPVQVSQATASNLNATVANPALTDIGAGEYETVAASQTAQVLGTTGAVGDFLAGLLVTPATTSPGNVIILDNATSVTVFTGGASSVTNLVPFFIPLGIKSVSGAWKVTTGANVSCIGVGNFT